MGAMNDQITEAKRNVERLKSMTSEKNISEEKLDSLNDDLYFANQKLSDLERQYLYSVRNLVKIRVNKDPAYKRKLEFCAKIVLDMYLNGKRNSAVYNHAKKVIDGLVSTYGDQLVDVIDKHYLDFDGYPYLKVCDCIQIIPEKYDKKYRAIVKSIRLSNELINQLKEQDASDEVIDSYSKLNPNNYPAKYVIYKVKSVLSTL